MNDSELENLRRGEVDNALYSAADNHNVARGEQSWFQQRMESITGTLSGISEGITKGTPAAVVSGLHSIGNSGVAIANFLGADVEPFNTYETLRGYDSDLAGYYLEHKEGIDITGFVATSFIPGTVGIKALQAAKAGFIGTNTARATGLLPSLTRDYAAAARAEFAAGSSPFTLLEGNTVKALAQGFGNMAVESAAFEIAVAGTMFKSPVLEEQSLQDLGWNIVTGTLIGGGVGGVLHGVGITSGIKKSRAIVDRELYPYRNINELEDTADPSLKILNYYQQKFNIPEPKLLEDIGPPQKGTVSADLTPERRFSLITTEREKTVARIDVLLRQEFQRWASGDAVIANRMFEYVNQAKGLEEVIPAILHTQTISRISQAETKVFGDVHFPIQGITAEKLIAARESGDINSIFTPKGTKESIGYDVTGDLSQLRVTGAKLGKSSDGFETKDAAFGAGFDVFRNSNGSISINPRSTILTRATVRREENNFILDMEQNGAIVDKAIPGIQDLATKANPITVRNDQVLAGNLPVIQINPAGMQWSPIEGSVAEAQARYIWAQEQKNIRWEKKVVSENDLPLLEKAYYSDAKDFTIKREDGVLRAAPSGPELEQFIWDRKYELAQRMQGVSLDEMAMRLNVSEERLTGGVDDIAKIRPGVDYKTPRYIRVEFNENVNAYEQLRKNAIDGAIDYELQRSIIKQKHNQNFSNYAGPAAAQFPEAPNLNDPGRLPTSYGAGASFAGFANSPYGSYGAWAQFVGTRTNALKIAKSTEMAEQLNPAISAVIGKGPDAVAEWGLLNNRLRQEADAYVFDPRGGTTQLIPRKFVSRNKAGQVKVAEGANDSAIPIRNPEVAELARTHAYLNNERQPHIDNLRGSAGLSSNYDDAVVYPTPINTQKLKHFVLVEPREISAGGQKQVIAAKDEATLIKLIGQIDKNSYRIITKTESEEWHKAIGDYDFALGLNESHVNSELKRKGVLSQYTPDTGEGALTELMDWHTNQVNMLATRMVEHKYSQPFLELQHLGDRYTNIATSQFRSLTDALQQTVKDPYNDIVKTALDISRAGEYQWWKSFNEVVRNAIEYPVVKMRDAFRSSQHLDDKLTDDIFNIAQDMGYQNAWSKSALEIAQTNVAARPWLPRFIARGQALMSATLLQMDFFNAINNTIGSPIILSAEMNSLKKGIMAGDATIAGKLADLTKVALPDGSQIELPTTGRLIKNAIDNYFTDARTAGAPILTRFQKIGAVTDVLQQERQMLDELTWKFTETESEISKKLDRAYEFGKKWTGNRRAEEMTRFVAADVMRQVTDIALESGVLRSVKEADEYIQLFVNRTQGNYLHSQRPIVFQGVVGQAVSLFQTYQFNLMQQLFRYVGEGDKKTMGILLGMQGSIYGLQGLPAFNFLNTHIVGNASGNTNHKDLYEAGNSVFGKALGDWILYGAGSNALGLIDPSLRPNLYSRGDINPRRLTVLPTNIADIPLVAASTRFVGNLYETAKRMGNGGDIWPSLSQAIEHNGLSRPLAGLAQSIQGYTTTSKGSLLTGGQDLFSIATLTRVGGAKPFDEGVALDQLYRINAYRAKNIADIQELGSAIKTTMVGNRTPSEEKINAFAAEYAKRGGHIEQFSRFFTGVMTSANKSQVNTLSEKLNSPFAKQMQVIMGGEPLPDFQNQDKP
jgi:hypothetical protein